MAAKCSPQDRGEAADRLEALLRPHPGYPWVPHYLAHIFKNWPRSEAEIPRAEFLYRQAIEGFSERGEVRGELFARESLYGLLHDLGRLEEAEEQIENLVQLTEGSPDAEMRARGHYLRGKHLFSQRTDLHHAYDLLQRAARDLFGPGLADVEDLDQLRINCLLNLVAVALELGRPDDAFEHSERADLIARQRDDQYSRAAAGDGRLHALLYQYDRSPTAGKRAEILEQARSQLALSDDAGHWEALTHAHLWLGNLTGGETARVHFDRCTEIALTHQAQAVASDCLLARARQLARLDPDEAHRLKDRALEMVTGIDDPRALAYARTEAMQVSWLTGPHEIAVRDSLAALEAIEALRSLQTGATGRAELFSEWVISYQYFAAQLLRSYADGGSEEDLDLAFLILERMRSRALQELLDRGAAPSGAPPELEERRRRLRQQITEVNRQLLYEPLSDRERQAAYQTLEELEMDEVEVRRQTARFSARTTALEPFEFATLAQVRAALAPDEALLSFVVSSWKDVWEPGAPSRSWLIAVTRQGSLVHRLPASHRLAQALNLFLGLFEPRRGEEVNVAAALYHDLLGPVLDRLPPRVRKLILVPDGPLHHLPFGALRDGGGTAPLAARYQISRIPSATLWLQWRRSPPSPAPRPALVLAVPEAGLGAGADGGPALRASDPALGEVLPSLPFAETEARAIRRHLGRGTLLLVGPAATERSLKTTPLDRFGILHLAAHATADVENPERSGVYLTPDASNPDGWLQFREIVDLDLAGRPVVLSACRSATGTVLRGEGVFDLARAFFRGGSHAVVGSLWPLQDREAAGYFDRFYRHLSEGRSLSGALRQTQRELIEAGSPAAAWAGIVVIGDGEIRPVSPVPATPVAAPALAALALLALAVTLAARRRAARP